MLTFPAMLHVGVVVHNLDQAENALKDRFGFGFTQRFRLDVRDALYKGSTVSYSADFGLAGEGGSEIEYIAPVGTDPSPYFDALQERGEHQHHIAYVVPSIEERLAQAKQAGAEVTLLLDAKMPGMLGRFVYAEGLLPGLVVELLQMEKSA